MSQLQQFPDEYPAIELYAAIPNQNKDGLNKLPTALLSAETQMCLPLPNTRIEELDPLNPISTSERALYQLLIHDFMTKNVITPGTTLVGRNDRDFKEEFALMYPQRFQTGENRDRFYERMFGLVKVFSGSTYCFNQTSIFTTILLSQVTEGDIVKIEARLPSNSAGRIVREAYTHTKLAKKPIIDNIIKLVFFESGIFGTVFQVDPVDQEVIVDNTNILNFKTRYTLRN